MAEKRGSTTIKKELAHASENILQIIKYEIYRQEIVELGIHSVADPLDQRKTERKTERERDGEKGNHGGIRARFEGVSIGRNAAENDERATPSEKGSATNIFIGRKNRAAASAVKPH